MSENFLKQSSVCVIIRVLIFLNGFISFDSRCPFWDVLFMRSSNAMCVGWESEMTSLFISCRLRCLFPNFMLWFYISLSITKKIKVILHSFRRVDPEEVFFTFEGGILAVLFTAHVVLPPICQLSSKDMQIDEEVRYHYHW